MTAFECREVFARLSEFLDGELPADMEAGLARHIGDCAPCVEFVESLKKSKQLTRRFQGSVQPAALAPSRREELREALRRCLDTSR